MADIEFTVKCGFFDAVDGDRRYSADEMNRPYKRVITEGVFATPQGTPSTDLQVVSAGDGMKIKCKAGEGLFGSKWFQNVSDITITVPSNIAGVPRVDSVIVQVDKRNIGRTGKVVYREGIPASSPAAPAINTIDNVIEFRVANIYVASGAIAINNDAITDLRGSASCPWITSLIQQVDTSTLYTQWQTAYQNYYNEETEAFNAFMKSLTEQLEVSTNILTLESQYTTSNNGETVIPINIASFNKDKDVLMVRVNHLFVSQGADYSIANDSSTITLTKDLTANQIVEFLVLQSVVVGDTATLMQEVQKISAAVTGLKYDSNWINFYLESGATAYDSNTTPGVRKYNNQVFIRGAVKNVTAANTIICTLPATMCPAQKHIYTTSHVSSSTSGTVTIEIGTNGQVKVIGKSGTVSASAMIPIATNFIVG